MEKIYPEKIDLAEKDRVFRVVYFVTLLILIGFLSLILERLISKEYKLIQSYAVFASLFFVAFVLVKLKQAQIGGYLVIVTLISFAFYISYLHSGLQNAMLFAIPGILVLAGLMFPQKEFYFFTLFAILVILAIAYLEFNGLIPETNKVLTYSDVFDRVLIVLLSAIGIKIFSNEIRKNLAIVKKNETEIRLRIEELTASESRFKNLFENSLDPILLIDDNLCFIDCNFAAVNFLSLNEKKDVIGKNILDFSLEYQNDGILSMVKAEEIQRDVIKQGKKIIEWNFKTKNNKPNYVELSCTLIPYGNKNFYLSHWRDITERKLYENELKEKQLFIERITEQSPDVIYIYDVIIKEFLYFNKDIGQLLGYLPDELPREFNEKFNKLIHPDDISTFKNYHNNIHTLEEKYSFRYDYRLIAKDGTWKWFSGRESEFQRENGKIVTIIGAITDVSERKQTELAIKLSEQKFSTAFKSSPVSINITRRSDDTLIDVNETFEKLTGYKRDEVLGQKGERLGIWWDNTNKILMADLLTGQKRVNERIFDYIDRNERKHKCRYTSELIEINGESCALTIVVDITEQFAAEQALSEAENKFKLLFKTSPNALLITSFEEKRILEMNDIALKIIGKNREDVIGKTLDELELLKNEDRLRLLNSLEQKGIIEGLEINVTFEGISRVALFYGQFIEMDRITNLFLTIVDITELKQTTNALKQSEEMYRTLMENMNEAVLQTDLEDKVVFVNKRFEKMLGYESNEILGKNIIGFLLNEKDTLFIEEANKKRKKKIYEQYEISLKHKNGFNLDFLISASPIIEPTGEVSGSIGVMTNITDMKKAVDQLKSSEERFRLIAENSTDIISIQDMEGKFKYLSPSCYTILGYEPEELLEKTPESIFKPAYHDKLKRAYNNPSSTFYQSSYTLIFEATAKNGQNVWLESTLTIVRDVYNNPKEIQALSRDITERKNIELELEDAIRFNTLIMNSLPIALISVDRNLEVSLYNNTAMKYKKNIKGINKLFPLFPLLNVIKGKVQDTILNNKHNEDSLSVADENGDLKYLKFTISPIERLGKIGCVILIDDITHTRNMEQLMIQSEKMMSVAGLAAGMAHEINNPLGTIVQGCQNILRRVSKDLPKNVETAKNLGIDISIIDNYFQQRQIIEIIESMRAASSKAAEIIKNMLQFSRKSESKMVMFSTENLLEQTSELANNDYDFKKKYDYKNIKVIKEYQPNLPEVKMTITEMEQVVFNLIRNAVQAMRNSEDKDKIPTITLRTFSENKFVVIEIEDNGPGIPEKIKSRIFEPFFTTKEVGEGTGLGLSVSYMIITKNHKGKIEVDTKVGKGTKFIIKLPK